MIPFFLSLIISVYSWAQYNYAWSVRPNLSDEFLTIRILITVIALLLSLMVNVKGKSKLFLWMKWLLFTSNVLVLLAFCFFFIGLFMLFPEAQI